MLIHSEYDEIHNIQFHVCIGPCSELNSWFETIEPDEEPFDEDARGWCYLNESERRVIIWAEEVNMQTFMHETVHAVFFIYNLLGIEYNGEQHEHFCVYSEYVFNLFLKTCKIQPNLKKIK